MVNCPHCGAANSIPRIPGSPANYPAAQPGYDPAAYGYPDPNQGYVSQPAEEQDPLAALAAAQQSTSAPYHGGAYNPISYGYGPAGYSHRRVGSSQQGMAITGFVLSFVFPLLGIIFSAIALSGMKRENNYEGHGLAQAGLVLSIIFVLLSCVWIIVVLGAMSSTSF
jgi:hypothetical protein